MRVLLTAHQGPLILSDQQTEIVVVIHDKPTHVQFNFVGYLRMDDRSEELSAVYVLPHDITEMIRLQKRNT